MDTTTFRGIFITTHYYCCTKNSFDFYKFFSRPEGYVEFKNNQYLYTYQYKDHLGNIRLTYRDGYRNHPTLEYAKDGVIQVTEIIEENNYYPFGLKHKGYNDLADYSATNKYKYAYGGKELNDELGLDLYDFGARNYDAAIGRWLNVDPLAEKFVGWTPYNYAYNDPINWIDPTGMAPDGWIEQHDGDQTTITFDPNVNTVAEATAAGYENVSQVVQSGTFDGQYNLNSDGSVTGGDANWTRSQRYGGMSYFWADNNTEVRTYNTNIYDSTLADAQYLDWRRRSSGAITPIGGSFDIFGFKEMFFGEVATATGNPYVGIAISLAFNKGKVSVSNAMRSHKNLQSLIKRGQSPSTIKRFDRGKILGEKDHVHFTDGSALNIDGTWKHGFKVLTNKEIKFLQSNGWTIP